jgi:hypothetical protein
MNKLILFLIVLLPLFGCKKKLTQFYIEYNSTAFVQSTVPVSSPFSIYTPDQTTDSEFEFEVNDTRKDRIREILLKNLELSIIDPSGKSFSFLNSIEIFISSANNPEQKVAFKEEIPNSIGSKLVCDVSDVDLQAYIKEDKFSLRLRTVTDEILTEDVTINIYSNFLVDAQLIK